MIDIIPFFYECKNEWDDLVRCADNGHFMFMRDYMEYHKDRFSDASYLVQKSGKIIAILPGVQEGTLWHSHGGLTFGGLMVSPKYNRISVICEIYELFFKRLKLDRFQSALIKPVPWIYHKSPCEGEIYYLNRYGKDELSIEVTTTVSLFEEPTISSLRKRMQKKALQAGLIVQQSDLYGDFWNILSSCLDNKYDRQPVHTCQEIEMLARKFPSNIKLFSVFDQEQNCLGGSLIFVTDTLWHAQYISANETGMKLGALDLLFLDLIKRAKVDGKRYFDFGISTEENGQYLNENLALFKEGFGARTVLHQKILVAL